MNMTSRKRRGLTLAACCGVHGLQDGLVATQFVLLPILAQAFGLGYAQIGVVRAASAGAMMLFELPSGMLAERLGERSLMVFGLLCAGLGYLLLAGAGGVVTITLCLFLVGLGAAFQHALSSAVISTAFRDGGRRTALGTYNSSGDLGKLAFTGLFSLCVGAGVAWQGVAAGFGVIAVLAAFAMLLVLTRLEVGGRPALVAGGGSLGLGGGWGIRDRTGFAALVVIVSLDIGVQSGFLTFLAFLMTEKQVPVGLAAMAVVLTLAGGIGGKFGCGFLAERIGVRRALVVVQGLTAAGIMAVLAAPTLAAYALLPLLGVVLQGSSSITYGLVGDLVSSERQSRGFALIYSVSGAAAVVGPIVFGLVGDGFGLAPAMLTMACAVVLPLPLCLLLQPLNPRIGPGVAGTG